MKPISNYPFQIPQEFGIVHFADLYTIEGFPSHGRTVDQLAELLFDIPVPGVKTLLKIRDMLVRPLGLKTTSTIQNRTGDFIAGFPVLQRSEACITLGKNDRHLNFRIFIQCEQHADGSARLHLSTAVHFNNWLGRAYFVPVRPMHRLIVGCMARRAQKLLAASRVTVQ